RQMFVFTHMPVGVGDPIGKILRDQFPEVVQFAEVQTGPQYPGKAIFGHLGNDEAARRDRVSAQATAGWILFDAEHIGWRSVEFCLAAQARSVVSTIAGYGALGIGGRTSRDYGAGMGTLLEGVSYAGSRTAWSLDAELDTLMGEWIGSYFGPGAPVDELRRILLAHDELFRKGVLVQSVSLYDLVGGNEHEDQVLATAYHGALRYPQILELFAPEGTKMKDVLSRYRDRVIAEQLGTEAAGPQQVLDEKDQAVALATELVAKVKALRGRLATGRGELVEPDRYARLLEIHENLLRLMRANRDFVTALQLEARLRADPKLFEQLHPTYVEALDLLEETAYRIRTAKGDGFFYGYTRGLMNYVQIARLRLGAMKVAQLGA
ncbi:MAG: hypothetical protein KAX78_00860, partial [Phycisphaerae bacterium]|nr:hypothetical protein [Phycisphaerae bacterium]